MNHQKVYDAIIAKAKSENRIKLKKTDVNYVYYERHHILPKCLNGSNEPENLVLLTAKEHYICHKLLASIFKENKKLAHAFFRMTWDKKGHYNITSRDYEYAKWLISNIPVSNETRQRMRQSQIGKKQSPETIKKRSIANTGKNKGKITIKDKDGICYSVSVNDPRYISGELVAACKGRVMVKDKNDKIYSVYKNDPRYISGELITVNKGKFMSKDKDGNVFNITKDDPRYISGELIAFNKGKVIVKDKDGKKFKVDRDDPRYISGELVALSKGRKWSRKDKE